MNLARIFYSLLLLGVLNIPSKNELSIRLFNNSTKINDWLNGDFEKVSGLSFCLQPNGEYGYYFKNTANKIGILKRVSITINNKDVPFFIKIYLTNADGKPIQSLLKEEIAIVPNSREVEIYLADKNIEIPKTGFLLSIRAASTSEHSYKTFRKVRTLAFGSQEKTTDYERLCIEATADINEQRTWHKFPNRPWTLQSATYFDPKSKTRKALNLIVNADVDWGES